jgi:hypothetical protein
MSTRIHVFAVAVESYQIASISKVDYAENDAREFIDAWKTLGADALDCITLLSNRATKTAIQSSFKKFLNGVIKDDLVIFFFAGHGIAFNDVSYVTAHDTQPGDIQATSISLASILKELRECKSDRVLLFIDACHSGLPISAGMRSITSHFSGDELMKFCADSEHHFGFAACKVSESSWPAIPLKHGIWSHSVIEALKGNAKGALEKGTLITSDSLRDYLSQEVPRLVRKYLKGNETQTPTCFGDMTKGFIVADLAKVLQARAASANLLGDAIKDAQIRGSNLGDVKRLSGFKKGTHFVPKEISSSADGFIRKYGQKEVEDQATQIHNELKAAFGYARKDITYACDDGHASIKTPDFDVDVSIGQDSEDAGGYVISTEVSVFRRPEVVSEDRFSKVFSTYCDSIVIGLSERMDLESKIDDIEAVATLADKID